MELIVATTVASLLAGSVALTINRIVLSRNSARDRQAAASSVYTATQMIARDLANFVRDGDLHNATIRVRDSGPLANNWEQDELLLISRSFRRARPISLDVPEGGLYEVQYRLDPKHDSGGVLWRRRDAMPDEVLDGGGVAVPVATGIVSLRIEVFDGQEWLTEWDSDETGYPYAVRVTCLALVGDSERRTAWAQSLIAFDRVPTPIPDEELQDASMTAIGLLGSDPGNEAGGAGDPFFGGGSSSGSGGTGGTGGGGGFGGGGGGGAFGSGGDR